MNNSVGTSDVFEISSNVLEQFRRDVAGDAQTQLAAKACWRSDFLDVCCRREAGCVQHVYSHKVEAEVKPGTNQRATGRCWLFAALNVARLPFCRSLNLDDFEFSQAYLFFWDKVERANYFLHQMVRCARQGEAVDGRLVSFLLNDPIPDGGQWDMFVNLVLKYGVMPKKCFPESFSSESSRKLNGVLKTKLRVFTREIRTLIAQADTTPEAVKTLLRRQMSEVFRVLVITLGLPPASFTWSYYDKTKTARTVGPLTPTQFYEQLLKPVFDVKQKVCLVNDPRPTSPFGQPFTVECLGNVVEGKPIVYNNQPIEVLAQVARDSIKAGEAVWFGCETGKYIHVKYGSLDTNTFDYEALFGQDVPQAMDKADRLIYGDSLMTHAMALTGCHIADDAPVRWRVENSHGEDRYEKGYLMMTHDWFTQFVFEVVVDRRHVPAAVLAAAERPVTSLPAWDPMGALAAPAAL